MLASISVPAYSRECSTLTEMKFSQEVKRILTITVVRTFIRTSQGNTLPVNTSVSESQREFFDSSDVLYKTYLFIVYYTHMSGISNNYLMNVAVGSLY